MNLGQGFPDVLNACLVDMVRFWSYGSIYFMSWVRVRAEDNSIVCQGYSKRSDSKTLRARLLLHATGTSVEVS